MSICDSCKNNYKHNLFALTLCNPYLMKKALKHNWCMYYEKKKRIFYKWAVQKE